MENAIVSRFEDAIISCLLSLITIFTLFSSLSSSLLWRRGGGFVDFSSLFVFAVAVCGDSWVFVRSVLEDLGFLWACFGLDWHQKSGFFLGVEELWVLV